MTSGVAPLTVQLNDTSTGHPSSWNWSFNDGTQNATLTNVSHTFSQAGTYNVVLTVKNGTQNSTISAQIDVHERFAAGFTRNVTTGIAPLTMQFNDTSTGHPTSWQWSFGDGSPNATSQNASHYFSLEGTYNVVLTVANDSQSSTVSAQVPIVKRLAASLTASVTSGTAPLTVRFNDTSTGYPASWQWSFDDGTQNVTDQYVTHTFVDDGTYNVTLTVANDTQSSSTTTRITVSKPAPSPSPAYSPAPSLISGPSPTPAPTASSATPSAGKDGGFPWWIVALLGAIIMVIVATFFHITRRN